MYQGRFQDSKQTARSQKTSARRRKLNKLFLVTLSVVLLLSIAGGTTIAYLFENSDTVENTFIPAQVSCSVSNDFKVTNTGNVDAYIRTAVVVNWMDAQGNIRGIAPVEGTDYTLTINSGWKKIDKYYYYTSDVASQAATDTAVCKVALKEGVTAPTGYTLTVEVVAEAIQAQGTNGTQLAYQDAWNISSITD